MNTQEDSKIQILNKILNHLEDPFTLTKNSKTQSFAFLAIALITISVPLMFFGSTEKKEYLMLLLVWISGISAGTLVILRSGMSQRNVLKKYIGKDKMRADLESIDNKQPKTQNIGAANRSNYNERKIQGNLHR